jgi:hypothetical protein
MRLLIHMEDWETREIFSLVPGNTVDIRTADHDKTLMGIGHEKENNNLHKNLIDNCFVGFEVHTTVVMKSTENQRTFRRNSASVCQDRIISLARSQLESRWQAETACHLLSRWYLARRIRPWRWRRYIPPKRLLIFNGLHGVLSQKTILFECMIFNVLTEVTAQITVLLTVTPCTLVNIYKRFVGICCLNLQSRRQKQFTRKHWWTSAGPSTVLNMEAVRYAETCTKVYGVTFHKTVIFQINKVK